MQDELHTTACLEYAAKTRKSFCILACADARREREGKESARVTELQTALTTNVLETRKWKSRAVAVRRALNAVIDGAIANAEFVGRDHSRSALEMRKSIEEVIGRLWILEQDTNVQLVPLVKAFLEEAETPMGDYAPQIVCPVDGKKPEHAFLRKWVERLRGLVPRTR